MTIKTQEVEGQTRIITKVVDGVTKISCECCAAEECCPYAWSQLGVGYEEQDLPTTITIVDYIETPRTATRTNTTWDTGNFTEPAFPGGPNVTKKVLLEHGTSEWEMYLTVAGSESLVYGGGCLFYVLPETPQDYDNSVLRDDFLDEYEVTTSGGTFTISRQSLCTWSGNDTNFNGGTTVTLQLNNASASRARANLWTMAGSGRTDGGPYDSPEGTYITGSYTWTVAEP